MDRNGELSVFFKGKHHMLKKFLDMDYLLKVLIDFFQKSSENQQAFCHF